MTAVPNASLPKKASINMALCPDYFRDTFEISANFSNVAALLLSNASRRAFFQL